MSEFDPSADDGPNLPDPMICLLRIEELFEIICQNKLDDQQGFYLAMKDREVIGVRTTEATLYGVYVPEAITLGADSQKNSALVHLFAITRDVHGLHNCSYIEISAEKEAIVSRHEERDVALARLLNNHSGELIEKSKSAGEQSDLNVQTLYYLIS